MDGQIERRGHYVWLKGATEPHLCWSDEKVLTALERDKVDQVKVGCRQGGCGACRVKVVSGAYDTGKMSRAHVSEDEEKDGFALSCRLFAKSDLVVEPAFRGPQRGKRDAD